LKFFDVFYYNLSFLIYGFIGYFLALILDLDQVSKKMANGWKFLALLLLSFLPFFLTAFLGLYDFIVVLQVLALYFLCARIFKDSKVLIYLGKNSLVIYVLHIAAIRALLFFL